jgi:hypothetical protein
METIMTMAMEFIQGVADSSNDILTWLITPVGIGEWSIAPFAILLPSSVGFFLIIVIIQIGRSLI